MWSHFHTEKTGSSKSGYQDLKMKTQCRHIDVHSAHSWHYHLQLEDRNAESSIWTAEFRHSFWSVSF